MAKQKFRYTRRSDFLGARQYIWYAEYLKNCYNAVDRDFCDAINISSEKDLYALIELWRNASAYVRERNIREAAESMELNMMYYERKGSAKGISRMRSCLAILEQFRLEAEQKNR